MSRARQYGRKLKIRKYIDSMIYYIQFIGTDNIYPIEPELYREHGNISLKRLNFHNIENI